MDLLTYDELRVVERNERESNKLTDVDESFIDRFNSYIIDKQSMLDKSDDNIIAQKVKERTKNELVNARKSFKGVFEHRAKKIFNQVLVDTRMGVKPETEGMLSFEAILYNQLRNTLNDYFNQLTGRKLKKEDNPVLNDNNVLVRFINDFPEFAWGQSTLGPFKQEDVANLPLSVVKLLLEKEAIKEVLSE
ncbi:MAG: hypothetical protein WC307_03210 [Candidatus Nanoarchaeia archaeon]|jgi:hypothetical protein